MKTDLIAEKLSPFELPASEASIFEKRIAEADQEFSGAVRQPSFLRKPEPRSEYERVKCNDIIFVFKYDEKKPDMLHIYSRHLTTPDDVITLFFNQDAVWDEERKRFENFSDTHGLYWFWCNKEKRVAMVISCFKRPPERS